MPDQTTPTDGGKAPKKLVKLKANPSAPVASQVAPGEEEAAGQHDRGKPDTGAAVLGGDTPKKLPKLEISQPPPQVGIGGDPNVTRIKLGGPAETQTSKAGVGDEGSITRINLGAPVAPSVSPGAGDENITRIKLGHPAGQSPSRAGLPQTKPSRVPPAFGSPEVSPASGDSVKRAITSQA
jgi:hypothetical protein